MEYLRPNGSMTAKAPMPNERASHRDHNPPAPHRMLSQFVRPRDLRQRNSLANLEPRPARRKGSVQILRRRHLGLRREIIAPQEV